MDNKGGMTDTIIMAVIILALLALVAMFFPVMLNSLDKHVDMSDNQSDANYSEYAGTYLIVKDFSTLLANGWAWLFMIFGGFVILFVLITLRRSL
jgi:flagellar basal body-associated protein FliL